MSVMDPHHFSPWARRLLYNSYQMPALNTCVHSPTLIFNRMLTVKFIHLETPSKTVLNDITDSLYSQSKILWVGGGWGRDAALWHQFRSKASDLLEPNVKKEAGQDSNADQYELETCVEGALTKENNSYHSNDHINVKTSIFWSHPWKSQSNSYVHYMLQHISMYSYFMMI